MGGVGKAWKVEVNASWMRSPIMCGEKIITRDSFLPRKMDCEEIVIYTECQVGMEEVGLASRLEIASFRADFGFILAHFLRPRVSLLILELLAFIKPSLVSEVSGKDR